jgi:MazG family protein
LNAPKTKKNQDYTLDDLITIMARLRDPEGGCPWDLEQNFKSIAPYTIEEAYEVADAIDRGDMDDLREELGDLLLQPIYHAQMANEDGAFSIHDVINDIAAKMIHRHPHVFGDTQANSAADVNVLWDERKALEKGKMPSADKSALNGVPRTLPALLRAQKLTKKAAKVGFEWNNPDDVLKKLEEEIGELRTAIANKDTQNQEEELGDVLFVLANLGRVLDINAEEALRKGANKFERRFKGMESDIRTGKMTPIEDASLDQLIRLWDMQKDKEKP